MIIARASRPSTSFFFEADPEEDLSAVVRPRTTPLLQKVGDRQRRQARLVHLLP